MTDDELKQELERRRLNENQITYLMTYIKEWGRQAAQKVAPPPATGQPSRPVLPGSSLVL